MNRTKEASYRRLAREVARANEDYAEAGLARHRIPKLTVWSNGDCAVRRREARCWKSQRRTKYRAD